MVQSVTHLLHKLHCANYFLLMVLAKQQNLTEYRIAWNASFSAYNCQWFHYPILFYSYIVRLDHLQTSMFFFMFYLSFYNLDPKKGKWAQIFKKSLSCQLRYMLLFIDMILTVLFDNPIDLQGSPPPPKTFKNTNQRRRRGCLFQSLLLPSHDVTLCHISVRFQWEQAAW